VAARLGTLLLQQLSRGAGGRLAAHLVARQQPPSCSRRRPTGGAAEDGGEDAPLAQRLQLARAQLGPPMGKHMYVSNRMWPLGGARAVRLLLPGVTCFPAPYYTCADVFVDGALECSGLEVTVCCNSSGTALYGLHKLGAAAQGLTLQHVVRRQQLGGSELAAYLHHAARPAAVREEEPPEEEEAACWGAPLPQHHGAAVPAAPAVAAAAAAQLPRPQASGWLMRGLLLLLLGSSGARCRALQRQPSVRQCCVHARRACLAQVTPGTRSVRCTCTGSMPIMMAASTRRYPCTARPRRTLNDGWPRAGRQCPVPSSAQRPARDLRRRAYMALTDAFLLCLTAGGGRRLAGRCVVALPGDAGRHRRRAG
jgi:hypothetical protein